MDRNKNAWKIEGVKNILCIYWIVTTGDWFGSNQLSTSIGPAAIVYFIASSVAVYYFSTIEKTGNNKQASTTAKLFIQD
jgi:hypothetical protein